MNDSIMKMLVDQQPVLIAEDDRGLNNLIQKHLTHAGYATEAVYAGHEVLSALSVRKYALLLVDYILPDAKADQLIGLLSKKGISVPFVIMTGHGDQRIAVSMMKLGARDYVIKDKDFLELLPQIVKRILKEIRKEKDLEEAQQALHESERRLSALMNNLPGMAYRCKNDPHWTMDFVSGGCRQLIGYTADDLQQNRRISYGDLIHPDDRSGVWDTVQKALAEKRVFEITYRIRTSTGEERFVWEKGSGVFSPKGEVVGVEGFIHDVTAAKLAEEVKENLENQVRHAQKLEAIGQLAGGVAHDFNNLLVAIVGYADLIKTKLPNDARLQRFAQQIIDAATKGGDLSKQLLAFARKGRYVVVTVDVHQIIDEVLSMLGRTIDRKINIRKSLKAEQSLVKTDAAQMENALLNLGINARDAMPKGGTLVFGTDLVELDDIYCKRQTHACAPGRYVCITVSDTGIGMSKETQARIFEPFFTTKEVGKGTGLGLASVYGFVKQSAGYIHVYSELGHGSVFRTYLPLSGSKEEMRALAPTLRAKEEGTGHVLLVDDESEIREIAFEILRTMGYTVTCCKDGAEAAAYFRKNHEQVDLVILDMIMPVKSGDECFYEMKEIDPGVPVIIASGFSEGAEMGKLVKCGARMLLQKPFTREMLSSAVAQHIRRRS